MSGQKVSNSALSNNPDYTVEVEEQAGQVLRQVIKVAEMPAVSVTGGATEAKQDSIITELQGIASAQLPDGHNVTVDNASLAITAASLPLPSGAATSALQTTGNSSLSTISGHVARATSIISGVVTVTTAGTRVQLPSNACRWVVVTGLHTNTGFVYVGSSSVASGQGLPLAPTQNQELRLTNTNLLYVDADTSGDRLCFIAGN